VTKDAWLLVDRSETLGIATQAHIYEFLREDWTVPQHRRSKGRQLWRIFDSYGSRSNRQHDDIKCSASELLSLYSLLRHYFERRVPDHEGLRPYKEAFCLACGAADLIMAAQRGVTPTNDPGVLLKRLMTS